MQVVFAKLFLPSRYNITPEFVNVTEAAQLSIVFLEQSSQQRKIKQKKKKKSKQDSFYQIMHDALK